MSGNSLRDLKRDLQRAGGGGAAPVGTVFGIPPIPRPGVIIITIEAFQCDSIWNFAFPGNARSTVQPRDEM